MIYARIAVLAVGLAGPTVATTSWVSSAGDRLEQMDRVESGDGAAVASAANEGYCTPALKKVLRRVLKSCGLLDGSGSTARGCEPANAKQVATMSGDDFNSLFLPMRERGAIIQFEQGEDTLDDDDKQLVDNVFSEQAGASYFFVVSRASPEGTVERNRELSQGRAEGLMGHLRETFNDPNLDQEVGLLWLGEEFAQLDPSFCDWQRSGSEERCTADEINRTAFVAWIDCRL